MAVASETSVPDTSATPAAGSSPHVVLPWIVRLRWFSLVALAAGGWAAVVFWRVRLPPISFVLLAALAATNAALTLQLRAPSPRHRVIIAVLLLDVGLLTGVLYLVGGPMNPLSVIYLVEITFAAVTLGHRWAVLIALLSNVAYGLTFFYSHPLVFTDPGYSGRVMTLHLWGMWMALAAASGLIAHFVSRVSEALERRDAELTQLRAAAARSDRLAALLSLGAGAAHELATPLSTISTAAHELVRHLQGSDPSSAHGAQYAAIIRGEVERCRIVIDRLSGRAPSTAVDGSDLAFQPLVDEIRYRVGDSLAQRLDVTCPQTGVLTGIPAEPLRQTLVALVRNAFDASAQDQRVGLAIERSSRMVSFNVVDRGRGMTTDEAAHAGEPFFTTKPAGMGLGMGLFLARSFAAQMGGTLEWSSVPDRGTSVVLRLPIQEAP